VWPLVHGGRRAHRALGNQRWLVVNRPADQLWGPVRDFWQENGFLLTLDQANLGIMETDWAENRAKIPQDFIRKHLGKVFDSPTPPASATVPHPLERNAHRRHRNLHQPPGMIEVYNNNQKDQTSGSPAADPELEAEFLRRLMVKLGVPAEQSKRPGGAGGTVQTQPPAGHRQQCTPWCRSTKALTAPGAGSAWRWTAPASPSKTATAPRAPTSCAMSSRTRTRKSRAFWASCLAQVSPASLAPDHAEPAVLRFRSLGSGSTGNATVIEAGNGLQTTRLLVDCGLGQKHLEARLAAAGLAPGDIDAIFITHEHADHIGCARPWALRQRIPVWMSQGTYAGIGAPDFAGLLHLARDAQAIELGELQVLPFTVPHDAREPLQLVCSDGNARLGLVTDLGHASAYVLERLAGCHALLLECNHDPDLLAGGSYPPFLKRRVGGLWGHLANDAAAQVAQAVHHGGLKQVVAAHLSEQNNRPELARRALAQALGCADADIAVADAAGSGSWFSA
jgi:phosphoribosyl 1,2-cyclic phosphodiesterase